MLTADFVAQVTEDSVTLAESNDAYIRGRNKILLKKIVRIFLPRKMGGWTNVHHYINKNLHKKIKTSLRDILRLHGRGAGGDGGFGRGVQAFLWSYLMTKTKYFHNYYRTRLKLKEINKSRKK